MMIRKLLFLIAALPALAIGTKPLDHSGQPQVGRVSYYAKFFAGRKMANGEPMRPESNNAASRTVPLGTTARVTNLENGRRVVLRVIDRGPYGRNYRKGTIIDVSRGAARRLGFIRDGLVRVRVEVVRLGGEAAR